MAAWWRSLQCRGSQHRSCRAPVQQTSPSETQPCVLTYCVWLLCDLKLFPASSKSHWCYSAAVGPPSSSCRCFLPSQFLLLISWSKSSLIFLVECIYFRAYPGLVIGETLYLQEGHSVVHTEVKCSLWWDHAVNVLPVRSAELKWSLRTHTHVGFLDF